MQVRVMNLNIHPYQEKFRENLIVIPPNGEVLMDEDEAQQFLQIYRAPLKDAQNRPDPLHFKMLKIHPEDAKALMNRAESSMVNHANGQRFTNSDDLAKALGDFTHMLMGKDAEAESEAVKAQNKALAKENKVLKSRLEIIEEKLGLKDTNDKESV